MPVLTRDILAALLDLPKPEECQWEVVRERVENGLLIRHLEIGPNGIPTLVLSPPETETTNLGILYCHAHGNDYTIGKSELLRGRPALLDPALGRALAQRGATVICPDLPCFGDRQGDGPESALSKAKLWNGQTLLGQMIADLLTAHDVLCAMARPDRTIALGISMGGTLAYLCAALRAQINACAHLCVFANIAPLIASGAHDLHGAYLTIPGLLPNYDIADLAALVAPRPQFLFTGAQDPLTPDAAFTPAFDRLSKAYVEDIGNLICLRDEAAAHHETPASRTALLKFVESLSE